MHYLTSLVFIEISRARGDAIDLELQRCDAAERGSRPSFAILRALTTRIPRSGRSDEVGATTLP